METTELQGATASLITEETEQAEINALVQPTATIEPAKANRMPEIPVSDVAVVNCLEDLQLVLANHQKWADAVLNPNIEVASGRANLKGADLRGYVLAGVNLSGANLSDANLESCDLEGANLSVANLQGAILACANLRHAKLRRARLEGADLRGADLTGANLTGVDLSKALIKTPDNETPKAPAKTKLKAAETAHADDIEQEQSEVQIEATAPVELATAAPVDLIPSETPSLTSDPVI